MREGVVSRLLQGSNYSATTADLNISVSIANCDVMKEKATPDKNHTCALVLGSTENNTILYKTKIRSVGLASE